MIGLVAKLPLHNAHNFTQMDRGIELFYVEDRLRRASAQPRRPRPPRFRPPIAEPVHAFEDKAPGFVAHYGPLHPGLPTVVLAVSAKSTMGRMTS